mgnify:CR=1 FL=1
MPRALKNANITLISYVDKAANQRQFFLTKSAGKPVFEKTVKLITKADDAEKLVYGVVYEPDVIDAHGDFMTAKEIEKAAHGFMQNLAKAQGEVIDTQHDFNPGVGEVVESYVAPADFTVGEHTITKGSWVLVTKASDEIWEKIQKGEITGYSMAGTAEAEEVTKAEEEDNKLLSKLVKALTGLIKGEVKDRFYGGKKVREYWDALYIFEDVFYSEIWSQEPDITRIKEAAADFADLLNEIANSDDVLKAFTVTKAGKKISAARLKEIQTAHDALKRVLDEVNEEEEEGEIEVKKEELQEILKEALNPINERLEKLEKAAEPQEPAAEPEPLTKEAVAEVLKSALSPIEQRLAVVEQARGISKSADGTNTTQDDPNLQKNENIWQGLL